MIENTLRKVSYDSVIEFPAAKTAGALTITGDVLNDYEVNTFGQSRLLVAAADSSKITDTLVVKAYGSWDEGTTYYQIDRSEILANGSGAVTDAMSLGKLVPRFRADAVFDASGALTADHGCVVSAIVEEADQNARKEITVTTLADAVAGVGTVYTPAVSLASGELMDYAAVAIVVEDSSDITVGSGISYVLQGSLDGTYWADMSSSITGEIVVVDTDAPLYLEQEYTTMLGKYFRLAVTGTALSALATANVAVAFIVA